MDLKGKKLLLMGGTAYLQSLKKYSLEQGFSMIGVGRNTAPYVGVCEKAYAIDTQDIEFIVEVVRKEHCSGIFVGASEVNIIPAIEVARISGINFYTNKRLWDALANKRSFKSLLSKHGIGTTKEFHVTKEFSEEDLSAIEFPVIIKPVDGSGARGISVAHNIEELKAGYLRACSISWTDTAVVEKYITGMDDMFIHYTIIDGQYSLACTFDRNLNYSQGGFTGMAVGYTYPSVFTKQYIETIDDKMKSAFADLGIKNGAINIQCFTDGNDFFFYESGYRLGGEQMYFFTEQLTGINVLELIVNHALTGKMADSVDEIKKDNPYFSKPCLSYYIPLKPGIITIMNGIDEIRKLEGVLNVTQFCHKGDVIAKDGSLSQVCLRMHLMRDNIVDLANTVDSVNSILDIRDENGNDMMLEKFDLRKTPYYTSYQEIRQ